MTGFESKRQAAQDKVNDDDDAQGYIAQYEQALLITYQQGFADGKRAAQPEQEPVAWVDGSSEWKDWCGRWFGPDADDDYLAKAVFDLPPMAQKFRYTALEQPEQRKPLTATTIGNMMPSTIPMEHDGALMEFARAIEAAHNIKERKIGVTTHCQCEACKNGNIHDSDCSVHNGDALPVGPCDCSLATLLVQPAESAQTFYQPAATEAIKILKSLGYVYEPTYTGLAWVAKKPEQQAEPVAWIAEVELSVFARSPKEKTTVEIWKKPVLASDAAIYTAPPQRPWVGLTDEEILSTDPWEILRADPWMGTSDSDINPYQILLKVRILEAKLKERNT